MSLDNAAVSSLRAEFPALQQTVGGRPIVFFDGPGGTQVHGSVIEAMAHYLSHPIHPLLARPGASSSSPGLYVAPLSSYGRVQRLRRADLCSRRLDSGPGSQFAGGSAGPVGVDLPVHRPRPEHGAPHLQLCGRHVSEPACEAGRKGRAVRSSCRFLHPGAAIRRPGAGPAP